MRTFAVWVVVGAAACGGGGAGPVAAKGPLGPAVTKKQAERDAGGLIREIYDTVGRGKKDSLFSLLDDSLVVFGPRGVDALATRTDTLVALGDVIDPKAKRIPALRSNGIEVVASEGGHSAWAFDRVDINGRPHVAFAILENANDLWQLNAAVVAEIPKKTRVKSAVATDAVIPPGSTAKEKIEPDAREAVERFEKGLADQSAWGAELALAVDIDGQVTRGKKEIKKAWKQRMKAKTRAALAGEVTAATTPDGMLAWVSAPITRGAEGEPAMPARAFAVFARRDGEWKLAVFAETVAFGAKGDGVAFKKELPPPPIDEEEERAKRLAAQEKKDREELAAKKAAEKKAKKKKAAGSDETKPVKKKSKKAKKR